MINSRNIEDLREYVAKACQRVIELAKKQGIKIIITSTTRDDEYQLLLYGKGRWTKGDVVTNAFRTAILDLGLEYQQISLSNKDTQFVESKGINLNVFTLSLTRFFKFPQL